MAKEVFGEYSAYTTPGGVRFMKNNKLVAEPSVPKEVNNYLRQKLGDDSTKVQNEVVEQPVKEAPKFPRPSEEELARMRAESLEVKPELKASPEKLAEDVEALTEDDFVVEETMEESTAPSAEQMQEVSRALDSQGREPLPRTDAPAGLHPVPTEPDFLESISIYTADLKDIAHALYDRFGIYTVYLGELPRADEINPLTASPFTKYHLGIAYQAAIFAQNQGLLDRTPEEGRKAMDAGREASANFQVDPVPLTMADNRQANSFAFRTSVRGTQTQAATRIEHVVGDDGQLHAVQVPVTNSEGEENLNGVGTRYDREQEELIVEPPMSMGARPIIRPNW